MGRYLRLIATFLSTSIKQEVAYRANFWVNLMYSLLNLGTGVLGIVVLFGQVDSVKGWTLPSTLAILGVYLTLSALNQLFISPSLDRLAGMDGEIWTGQFDYVVLRPLNTQFLASFRYWRPFALVDLLLGAGVLVASVSLLHETMSAGRIALFLLALCIGLVTLYAVLLVFSALVFWSPGFLFGWVFSGIYQMARYPVNLYPEWLRFVLTWIVPVGVMTTLPAQILTSGAAPDWLLGGAALSAGLFAAASLLFHTGLRRYASASS